MRCHWQAGHLTLFWLNEAARSLLGCGSLDPWVPSISLLSSGRTFADDVCQRIVRCKLLAAIKHSTSQNPDPSQPSPLIGLTNAAALVSPHVVPFQPFLLLSPFLHALLHPLFTTSSPLPSSPFRSHSSRRHHRPLR